MIMPIVALAGILFLRFGPDVPAMKSLRALLIDKPIGRLAAMQRHRLLFAIILVGLLLLGGEVIVVLGPEMLFVYAANLAIYFDAMAATAVLGALSFSRSATASFRTQVQAGVKRGSQSSAPKVACIALAEGEQQAWGGQ